jgi:hypothetical protein
VALAVELVIFLKLAALAVLVAAVEGAAAGLRSLPPAQVMVLLVLPIWVAVVVALVLMVLDSNQEAAQAVRASSSFPMLAHNNLVAV